PDDRAFGEGALLDHAFDSRAHLDTSVRRDLARELEGLGHIARNHSYDRDLGGREAAEARVPGLAAGEKDGRGREERNANRGDGMFEGLAHAEFSGTKFCGPSGHTVAGWPRRFPQAPELSSASPPGGKQSSAAQLADRRYP